MYNEARLVRQMLMVRALCHPQVGTVPAAMATYLAVEVRDAQHMRGHWLPTCVSMPHLLLHKSFVPVFI